MSSKTVVLVTTLGKQHPELLEALFTRMRQFGGHGGIGDQIVQALVRDASGLSDDELDSDVEDFVDDESDGGLQVTPDEREFVLALRAARQTDLGQQMASHAFDAISSTAAIANDVDDDKTG